MTFNEFGLRLRQAKPQLNAVPLNNEQLAQFVLNEWPELYDIISPAARKIKQVSEAPITWPNRRWYEGSNVEVQNEAGVIANRRAEITMLHEASMMILAESRGVPVTSLGHIIEREHETTETMRLERFRRDIGLEGGERSRLTPHYLIRQLEAELIDRKSVV